MSTIGTVARRKTRCPRCDLPLATVKSGEVLLAGCTKCRGVWVDRKIFDTISKRDSLPREPGRKHTAAAQRLKCPICYYWMEARNFGDSPDRIIDVCRRHGTWLDANELQSLLRPGKYPSVPTTRPSPISPAVFATTAAITAASTAAVIPSQDRSTLERTGELVFNLLDFTDLVDIGDLGDVADLAVALAEISLSFFDGV
jgi:Zn-finger nucleic acid-binding protein